MLWRSQHSPLTITAEGSAVSKAVTLAEISRRRLRGLHQSTQIGLATVDSGAAPAPAIAITLSLTPLDASQPGYQAPLTQDELHVAWIFDDELCELSAMDLDEASGVAGHGLVVPGTETLQRSGPSMRVAEAAADGNGEEKHGKSSRKRKRGGGHGASSHGGPARAESSGSGGVGRGSRSASAPAAAHAQVLAPRPRSEDSVLQIFD